MKRLFDFEVERKSLFMNVPNEGENYRLQKVSRDAIVRRDSGKVIGIVSNDYSLIEHKDVVTEIENALLNTGGYSIIKESVSGDGARLFIEYNNPDMRFEVRKGDFVTMTLIFVNSIDGSTRLGFMMGAMRLVCSNGMIVGHRFVNIIRKHTSGLELESVVNSTKKLTEYFSNKMPAIRKLAETEVNYETYLADIETRKALPVRMLESVRTMAQTQKTQTAWDLYNHFTSYMSHTYEFKSYDRYADLQQKIACEFDI